MYKYNKGRGRTEFRTWDSQNLLTEVLFDPVFVPFLPTIRYKIRLSFRPPYEVKPFSSAQSISSFGTETLNKRKAANSVKNA